MSFMGIIGAIIVGAIIGALATATVHAEQGREERARTAGLQVGPVSLQNYIVHRTNTAAEHPATVS